MTAKHDSKGKVYWVKAATEHSESFYKHPFETFDKAMEFVEVCLQKLAMAGVDIDLYIVETIKEEPLPKQRILLEGGFAE